MHVVRAGLIFASISSLALAVACGGSEEPAKAAATEATDPALSSGGPAATTSSSSSSSGAAVVAPFVCMDEGGQGWGHVPVPDSGVVEGPLACAACSQAKCTADVDACGANCECRTVVTEVITCVATGGDPLGCAAPAFGASKDAQAIAMSLFQCSQSKCAACANPGH